MGFFTIFIGVNLTFFPIHFLGLAGIPRRYSDYPDRFMLWNVIARIGSIISVVSVLYFLFILWEALVGHRPALSSIHIRTRIELIHSFPPINHSYTSIPVITYRERKSSLAQCYSLVVGTKARRA